MIIKMNTVWGFEIVFYKTIEENWKKLIIFLIKLFVFFHKQNVILNSCTVLDFLNVVQCIVFMKYTHKSSFYSFQPL